MAPGSGRRELRWDAPEGRSVAGPAPLVLLLGLERQESPGLAWEGLMAGCTPSGACCSVGRQPFIPFSLCQRKYRFPASPWALGC